MHIQNPLRGAALALVCLILLAIMPVIANSRPAGFDALSFAFALSIWQLVFSVPLFGSELLRGKPGVFGMRHSKPALRRMITVALVTGAMFGLSTYLYILGVERAGATNAAIAIQAYPLFAILWETAFLGRRKTMPEMLLTGVMLAALYYLGTGGSWVLADVSVWFFVALGVPFLWSIAHVLIKEELSRTPVTPAQVTFFRVAISTGFLAVLLMIVKPAGFGADLYAILANPFTIAMGLVYYLELVVWFHAVRHIDVSLASSITTPWPAVTLVLAYFFLGDAIVPYQIAALCVVVACIYGLTYAAVLRRKI